MLNAPSSHPRTGSRHPVPVPGPVYAALDLGTNNCRLLVAQHDDQHGPNPFSFHVIDSFSQIVRLGEQVSATGKLSEAAMQRTLAALIRCREKLERYPGARQRYVATEACRRAANGPEFLQQVEAATQLKIEIISAEEEARLAFLGCASMLTQPAERALVFDIGGGSTEFMWTNAGRAQRESNLPSLHSLTDWLSLPCGVMNLADRFGGSAFAELYYDDMVAYILSQLAEFDQTNHIRESISGSQQLQMLSTSGTVTTLAAVHLGLPRYDRSRIDGIRLSIEDIRRTIQYLRAMRPWERFNHPCIGSDRSDFIMTGCAIFEAISTLWPVSFITIADRGVREGIIISLMQETL